MKRTNTDQFIQEWSKYRQLGKDKYIFKKSMLTGVGTLIGLSIVWLFKGQFIFFNYANLLLIFFASFVAACIGSTRRWNINEKKYNNLINDTKD